MGFSQKWLKENRGANWISGMLWEERARTKKRSICSGRGEAWTRSVLMKISMGKEGGWVKVQRIQRGAMSRIYRMMNWLLIISLLSMSLILRRMKIKLFCLLYRHWKLVKETILASLKFNTNMLLRMQNNQPITSSGLCAQYQSPTPTRWQNVGIMADTKLMSMNAFTINWCLPSA